jgi:hypothetical protein
MLQKCSRSWLTRPASAARPRRRSSRPLVEALEDRTVPSGIQFSPQGVLSITGSQNDSVVVQTITPPNTQDIFIRATLDKTLMQFPWYAVTAIKITTGGGTNSVDLKSAYGLMPITVTSTGTGNHDTVTVESGMESYFWNNTPGIQVSNPHGFTSLSVQAGEAWALDTQITDHSIAVNNEWGWRLDEVDYSAPTAPLGCGVNRVSYFSKQATSIGDGNVVSVLSTAANALLTLDGTGKHDTVYVGRTAAKAAGSLANIAGPVAVNYYAGGATQLAVSDAGTTHLHNATITNLSISGMSPGTINYAAANNGASGVTAVSVTGSVANGNTFNVLSTAAAAPLTLKGMGNDTVTIGNAGSMTQIKGAVNVSNGSGATKLVLDDRHEGGGRSVKVQNHQITGMAPATISFTPAQTANSGVVGVTLHANPLDSVAVLEFDPFCPINVSP